MIQLLARFPVLTSPVALAIVATIAALAASLLLGVQDAVGIVIHHRP